MTPSWSSMRTFPSHPTQGIHLSRTAPTFRTDLQSATGSSAAPNSSATDSGLAQKWTNAAGTAKLEQPRHSETTFHGGKQSTETTRGETASEH